MKYLILFLSLIMLFGIVFLACDSSTNPVIDDKFPDPIDSVATNITVIVYSNGLGTILDTMLMQTEGDTAIFIDELFPYYHPPQYYCYARADGFYTEVYTSSQGDTFRVDLDAIPQVSYSVSGVIFSTQPYFFDCYLADWAIALTFVGGTKTYVGTTDAQGTFGFDGLPVGAYLLHFSYQGVPFSFNVHNSAGADFKEFSFFEPITILAPNIYLYPETTSQVQVTVSFPDVGSIIISEPEYNNGWDVSVTPEGIIDSQYNYLFYEAMLPEANNHKSGWVIAQSDLEPEFRKILSDYGCVGREIDDFVEFWVPRLDYAPWYGIYPQDVEKMITLDISPQPDNLLRLLFYFRGLEQKIEIAPYIISNNFVRDKFTAVEWGGFEIK